MQMPPLCWEVDQQISLCRTAFAYQGSSGLWVSLMNLIARTKLCEQTCEKPAEERLDVERKPSQVLMNAAQSLTPLQPAFPQSNFFHGPMSAPIYSHFLDGENKRFEILK